MSNTYCPGCRNPLKLGRFTACPSCGYDLVAGRPGGSAAAAPINPTSRSSANHAYGQAQWPPASGLPSTPAPSLVSDLFVFHGRLNRKRYFWLSMLALVIIVLFSLLTTLVADQVAPLEVDQYSYSALLALTIFMFVMFDFFVVFIWVVSSLMVKRLHDLDMPGIHVIWLWATCAPPWVADWALDWTSAGDIGTAAWIAVATSYIPCVAASIWIACVRGTNGDNKYGPPRVVFPMA